MVRQPSIHLPTSSRPANAGSGSFDLGALQERSLRSPALPQKSRQSSTFGLLRVNISLGRGRKKKKNKKGRMNRKEQEKERPFSLCVHFSFATASEIWPPPSSKYRGALLRRDVPGATFFTGQALRPIRRCEESRHRAILGGRVSNRVFRLSRRPPRSFSSRAMLFRFLKCSP